MFKQIKRRSEDDLILHAVKDSSDGLAAFCRRTNFPGKKPVFIQIRLKRDRDTGKMHVTESTQEQLENVTGTTEGSGPCRKRHVLPFSSNDQR